MVNGYCLEVDNAKRKHRCKMCEILERENQRQSFRNLARVSVTVVTLT